VGKTARESETYPGERRIAFRIPFSFMVPALPLGSALRRGALVTAANWQVVIIEMVLEALLKVAVAVPVVGGAFMVAVLLGADVRTLLDEGIRSMAELILSLLTNAPVALGSFVAAVALVGFGGSLIMFVVKAGTLAILVSAERIAPDVDRTPMRLDLLRRSSAYTVEGLLAAVRHFRTRAVVLAIWLGVAYVLVAVVYAAAIRSTFGLTDDPVWVSVWPIAVAVITSTGLVTVAAINLFYDLTRIVLVVEDCAVMTALVRLWRFLVADTRQVLGIFGLMGALGAAATAAALVATAGLALISWVPIVGLIVLPLQLVAWLVRGLIFQFMDLMTMVAYEAQYRRFAGLEAPAAPRLWVQGA
jgi:hypothetical protein